MTRFVQQFDRLCGACGGSIVEAGMTNGFKSLPSTIVTLLESLLRGRIENCLQTRIHQHQDSRRFGDKRPRNAITICMPAADLTPARTPPHNHLPKCLKTPNPLSRNSPPGLLRGPPLILHAIDRREHAGAVQARLAMDQHRGSCSGRPGSSGNLRSPWAFAGGNCGAAPGPLR